MQLTLREKGVNEVEAAEVPDEDWADVERLDHPLVLRVAITVLIRTKGVGDTLERVDDWASEIVSGVDLPLVAGEV